MPTIKVLGTPILVILVTLGMGFYSFSALYPKIQKQIADIEGVQTDLKFLENKVDVLKDFSTDSVSDKSDVTYIALPDTNPAAAVISQVRKALAENGVKSIKNISFSGGSNNLKDVNGVEINFEFEATSVNSVSKAIIEIQKSAPLVNVLGASILVSGENVQSDIKIMAQWSELPKTLPDLSSPVNNLSSQERTTFDKILTLRFPDFSQIPPGGVNKERTNPFN